MQYQLAEINIATFRVPMADPINAGFIANLDRVNALAEAAPGFVWRLVGEGNNALAIQAFENPNTAINMSVWTDMEALANFVYRNEGHREIMRRRKEWFDRMEFHLALWWVLRDIVRRSAKEKSGSSPYHGSDRPPMRSFSTGRSQRRMPREFLRASTNVHDRLAGHVTLNSYLHCFTPVGSDPG